MCIRDRHKPIHDMMIIADGYLKAAIMLAQDCCLLYTSIKDICPILIKGSIEEARKAKEAYPMARLKEYNGHYCESEYEYAVSYTHLMILLKNILE